MFSLDLSLGVGQFPPESGRHHSAEAKDEDSVQTVETVKRLVQLESGIVVDVLPPRESEGSAEPSEAEQGREYDESVDQTFRFLDERMLPQRGAENVGQRDEREEKSGGESGVRVRKEGQFRWVDPRDHATRIVAEMVQVEVDVQTRGDHGNAPGEGQVRARLPPNFARDDPAEEGETAEHAIVGADRAEVADESANGATAVAVLANSRVFGDQYQNISG